MSIKIDDLIAASNAGKQINMTAQHAFAMASMGYGWEDIALVTKIFRVDAKRLVLSVEHQRQQSIARNLRPIVSVI